MKKIIVITLLLFLAGCSSENFDDYLGYWKVEGSRSGVVEFFTLDGEIFMRDLVLINPDRKYVLTKHDDKLSVSGVFFELSEDKNRITFDTKTYSRMSEKDFEQMKAELVR